MKFVYKEPNEKKKGKFINKLFSTLHQLCEHLEIPYLTNRRQLLKFGYKYDVKDGKIVVEKDYYHSRY